MRAAPDVSIQSQSSRCNWSWHNCRHSLSVTLVPSVVVCVPVWLVQVPLAELQEFSIAMPSSAIVSGAAQALREVCGFIVSSLEVGPAIIRCRYLLRPARNRRPRRSPVPRDSLSRPDLPRALAALPISCGVTTRQLVDTDRLMTLCQFHNCNGLPLKPSRAVCCMRLFAGVSGKVGSIRRTSYFARART